MLTRAEFSALALAAQRDPQLLFQEIVTIATKGLPGQPPITRLALNVPQLKIHRALMTQRRAGRPPRAIVLKSRQAGVSTLGTAYMLATALCQPYSQSMLIAHLDDSAIALFKKVQFMIDRLPGPLKPSLGATRRNELVLDRLACTDGDIELRSLLTVASATGGEQWRGATLQCAHISEFAYFPRPEETLLGLLQAVPPHPQSLVLIESTANGYGNALQEEYDRAVAGESDFVAVFVPWFEMPEYQMVVPPDFELEPEERELKRAYKLSNEQVQWRRYALATNCGGNVDRLCQEFPSSSSEAFLTSGRPAFPVKVLREMAEAAHHIPLCRCVPHHTKPDGPPHCERGVLTEEGKFVRLAKGPLAVYRRPVSGHDYTLGADASAGIEGGDPACIQVFDRNTGEFVATWHGFVNPVAFAHLVATLAVWYNTAIVAPEVNNHGYSVVSELKNTIQYQRFYVWQRPDRIRNTFTNFYGWWCVDPESRVLTADLRWVPAKDIVLGDRLVGCAETHEGGHGASIPLRLQTVVERRVFSAPRIEVTMAGGQRTRVSANHPFLSYRWSRRDLGFRWVMARDIRPGDEIKALPMWETLRSYDAGRLSAFLDGEGHLSRANRLGGYVLMVSQAEGPLAEEIYDLWKSLRFETVQKQARHRARPHRKVLVVSGVQRFPDVLRALGSLRPTRLLRRWEEWLQSDQTTLRSFPRVAVETVREIGDGPVVGLATDPDHTLITDGLVGHNTSYATRPILIDTFNFALTDRDLVLYDPETISEALKFQWMTQQRAEGLGHDDRCFSPGTPVETQRGPVAIEHVTLGEQVLSHDGQWHRVTGRGARLVEEALVSLRVTGLPDAIHVTAEHRFWVQRRFRSGSRGFSESRWTPASILQRGDRVWVPKRPLGPPLSLTSDELYLLGWYLADGNLTPAGGLRITCGLREEACAQRLASILEALVQSHPTHWFAGVGRRGRRRRASRVTIHHRPKWIEVCCQNRWLDEWLRRWVGPARQKYVHPEIAAASETLPFVMGFLEGDGSQDQARQALSAAQRDLRVLRVIQRMLLDQGIWAAVYRSGHQALSLLHVGSPWAQRLLDRCPSLRFRRPTSRRAHPIAEDGGAGYWTLIRDAERCPYVGPVFNLSVEGAESYTVDGVAAHNCMAAMIAYRVHIEMPLLSTGLPPRVRYAEFEKGTPPEGPKLPNFSEEAWRETDQTLEEMRRGPGNLLAQYGNDEPREGEEPPDMGLDYYPDILD